jgi:EAL domain-containing protein (putative c-di-GMP-specific phosphodiesterase class I)
MEVYGYRIFENVKSSMPSKKRVIPFYALASLLLVLFTFSSGLYLYLVKDLEDKTYAAESALKDRMNSILIELKSVAANATLSCEKKDVKYLIERNFYSPMFKEYGLFDEDFRVYCSNFGPQSFSIYSSIADRIKQSKDGITVSMVKSNTLGEQTFFAFYQGENGIGINGLAPPKSLVVDVDHLLLPNYSYKLTIGKLALLSSGTNTGSKILDQQTVSLDDWAILLVVTLSSSAFWQHFINLLPIMFFSWLLLTAIFCAVHWRFLYYCRSLPHCINKAIKDNDMEVYFQPIISLKDQRVHDMEALIRWRSPYHGQVSPLTIIEITNRLGLIDDLTWMVIRKVGHFYRENLILLNHVSIAVNVDRHSLLSASFLPKLKEILEEFPELQGRLDLEVTETSALTANELPVMVSQFEHIKALGISLSVDDFGTGYSGLDFLRRFPYDVLKLDQVFTSTLQNDQFTRQILTSVTKLARELNMKVVAEGIERQDQLDAIKELGVDSVQGYYFSVPLPANQIITWLEKRDKEQR